MRLLGFDYGVAIYASDKMWTLDRRGHRQGDPRTAKEIALALGAQGVSSMHLAGGDEPRQLCLAVRALPGEGALRATGLAAAREVAVIEWPDGETSPRRSS